MALEDTTQLLLNALVTGGGIGMTPGANPYSPTGQGGTPTSEAEAAQGQDTYQAGIADFRNQLKDNLGLDVTEEQAKALTDMGMHAGAVGGDVREAMLQQAQGGGTLGALGGGLGQSGSLASLLSAANAPSGPAAANPQLRQALAYEALAQYPKYAASGNYLIGAMLPQLAPRMLGPYMEQQQQRAQQAQTLANQIKLAQTLQQGTLQAAQTRKALADAELAHGKAIHLGDREYQIRGNPTSGGFLFDPKSGDYQIIKPVAKAGAPLRPIPHQDTQGRKWNYYYQNPADFYAGKEPDRKELVGEPGSATERENLTKAAQLARTALEDIPALYEDGLTGPMIGRALSAEKAGGVVGQSLGHAYTETTLSPEQKAKAMELQQKVNLLNDSLNKIFTGVAYGDKEYARRQKSMALMTDYGPNFLINLKGSGEFFREALQLYRDKYGVDLLSVAGLPESTRKTPLATGFQGAPATNANTSGGVLVDQTRQQLRELGGY